MTDSALITFQEAIKRARYLARLYQGLVNQRKRAMRSDWASSFLDLMHWPQSAKIDRVDGHGAIVVLRDGATLTQEDFASGQMSDLLRASLVMTVSALDAYFHAKIIAHVVKCARRGKKMPRALRKSHISIPEFVASEKYKRRMTIIRNSLHRQLGYQSFQQPSKISKGLALVGVVDFWEKVAKRLKLSSGELQEQLEVIVDRRNQIAHEGDLSQSKKARNKPHDLKPKFVTDALSFTESFVMRAEDEINAQVGA